MRLLALLLLLAAADDTLVDAAKAAKEKRRKSTTKVLTNADVKKSKGRIVTTPNVSGAPVQREPTLLEKQAATRAADRAAEEKRAAADKLIASYEKELAAIEQSYYNTNDLDYRDTVLVQRFNDVKAKLDAARAARP
ncbi:MAG TPA: hypothetical protein VND45_15345 [Thermoanaerobaculia bacterium]|nr:hypothetical protein [Thermoanaerobaculia bacterium]